MSAPHPDSLPRAHTSPDLVESDFRPAARSVMVIASGPLVIATLILVACWAAVAMGRWPDLQGVLLLVPIVYHQHLQMRELEKGR